MYNVVDFNRIYLPCFYLRTPSYLANSSKVGYETKIPPVFSFVV